MPAVWLAPIVRGMILIALIGVLVGAIVLGLSRSNDLRLRRSTRVRHASSPETKRNAFAVVMVSPWLALVALFVGITVYATFASMLS